MKKGFLLVVAAVFLVFFPVFQSFGEESLSYCVYFTDEADENHYIFNPQRGNLEEGDHISIAFPEKIIGRDGFFWEALWESPKEFPVYGFGLQKFYIQYRRGASAGVSSEEDEELTQEKEELEKWLTLTWEADCAITGQAPGGGRDPYLMVSERTGNDRRITSLLSMIPADNKWRYFYMVGENYVPDTTALGREESLIYSAVTVEKLSVGEKDYHVVKVGICRSDEQMEENTGIPGSWRAGDTLRRKLGKYLYRFICVDGDYDTGTEHRKAALFLCDSVIRADIDSDGNAHLVFPFGVDNNYRFSRVRSWLADNYKENPGSVQSVPTGLWTAFLGSTETGAFEQLSEHALRQYDIGFQQLQDNMFCLSVEEAFKYRFHLWRFEGAEANNPQTQLSPYSRGYYLRTPVYEEDEKSFSYGQQIYVVDLVQGNIHPADTDSGSYGIRPAFTMPQD